MFSPITSSPHTGTGSNMSIKKISILGVESIYIGCGILSQCGKIAHEGCKAVKYVVISDENVAPLYLDRVLDSFEEATGSRPIYKILAPGEQAKCRSVKAEIEDWMLTNRCGRDCTVVALGGGVIGDLSGYVAATFMRGVKVVQIPTTLLAMVDSSVGGKTGIDTPTGKNLVGAFHHPVRIIMDLEVLKTLPDRQLSNGMAEVVKTALLWDASRFTELEEHVDEVLAKDPKWLQSIVEGSAGIKAEVVTKDEKEGGLRTLLNVGHSVGHAVEAFLQPDMLHGEAVAIGTVKEAQISRRLGYITEAEVGRITRCLQAYKLPVSIPTSLTLEGLMMKMEVDKKNKAGRKYLSLLERIGKCVNNRAIQVEDDVIRSTLAHAVEIQPMEECKEVELSVPGSKSLSNRALLIAALGKGKCKVKGLLHSDDTQVMLNALLAMKVCTVEWAEDDALLLTGNGGSLTTPDTEIYLGNAGTASRFLTTAATMAKPEPVVLTGNRRMKERPIAPLVDSLRENGVTIEYQRTEGCLPIKVNSNSGLPGGKIGLSANLSSQYVSSVLISGPYAEKELELHLTGGEVVSQPYIDMTISIMKDFGVDVQRVAGQDIYKIPKSGYVNPETYQVEADASSSTYPLAIPAIVGKGSLKINGIGSSSVQGDAHFAELLEKMGCKILQGSNETTVFAAEQRLKAVDVNMSDMTDAFMTAAVVMALAEGTSRITGIANQRVKECNRILAMVTEFAKLGIVARELPDGLEIEGTKPDKLQPASIHCYNDHRIAMSFAILGLKVPGITILDTACVEKTYPVFWDDIVNRIGATLIPAETAIVEQHITAEETIVLVGIRGAGKTTLGQHCADRMSWTFIDMDDVFEAKAGPIAKYIEEHNWDGFRAKEAALLEETLKENSLKCIIATGGGIVESAEGRKACVASKKVVFIHKSLEDTLKALKECGKPAWGEGIEEVYNRRLPRFKAVSQYELPVDPSGGWDVVCSDMLRLMKHITLNSSIKDVRSLKSFLSLTFDDVTKILPVLKEVEGGADALELRVDLLKDTSAGFVSKQVGLLRRHSKLPIIFTVRTKAQGGKYPDGDHQGAMDLLKLAARLGVEIIDVEMTLKAEQKEELLEGVKPSLVLMSYHDPERRLSWDGLKMKIIEGSCGGADIVKIVTTATEVDDCSRLRAAVREANITQPVIALAMGGLGKLSRALNEVMTPITHACMPVAAAPGQLSMASINTLRRLIGVLPDSRKFHLFGKPISASRSPLIHNTGFEVLGLAPGWAYSAYETDDIEAVKAVVGGEGFGGASVTIPLKEKVGALCGRVSEAAKEIGAVNTLTMAEDGVLEGDNTDWKAMRDLIEQRVTTVPTVGLCVGAGGSARAACYAMKQAGVKTLYVWNRTHEKAVALAADFGGVAVESSGLAALTPNVVISNIPGTAQESLPTPCFALSSTSIVIEMAYTPRVTTILQKAADVSASRVEGIQVLIEQALYQFKRWTGLNPPREAITKAVYATLD
eukprot:TRINITY_DN7328_c0_g1_i1.p1 TRINITY_DN7328_c0_g1~~TRINITY_DN7328_c0_g1_i1.p1  ORF type:complete len:1497 (+),score=475.05 TRINITY_DN7328_c0_g1_i1:1173-5663(+)